MKKFPRKYAKWIGMILTSIFMAFVMTGIVTAINFNGFPPNYIDLWMNAFSKMAFIAFGVIVVVRPVVETITKSITE